MPDESVVKSKLKLLLLLTDTSTTPVLPSLNCKEPVVLSVTVNKTLYNVLGCTTLLCCTAASEPPSKTTLSVPKLQPVPKVHLSLGSTCFTDTLSIVMLSELSFLR